jgi:hypothetical protein
MNVKVSVLRNALIAIRIVKPTVVTVFAKRNALRYAMNALNLARIDANISNALENVMNHVILMRVHSHVISSLNVGILA